MRAWPTRWPFRSSPASRLNAVDPVDEVDGAHRLVLLSGVLLALCASSGCSSTVAPGAVPGLEVLTPTVLVPSGGRAAVMVRSANPARVSVTLDGQALGTALSGPVTSRLQFLTPSSLVAGAISVARIVAVSEAGLAEDSEVTLVCLGDVQTSTATPGAARGVASVGGSGVIMTDAELWLVRPGGGVVARTTPPDPVATIAADDSSGSVLVAGAGNAVTAYRIGSSVLVRDEVFTVPDYDNSPEQPAVQAIRAIHVSGDLVATANDRGMSIIDRSQGYGWSDTYCRARSSMTTKLQPGSFEPTMDAVAVTADERVFAGGDYFNVNEAHGDEDDGTCRNPFPDRGTRPIVPPEEDERPWDVAAIAITDSFLWIGRSEQGIVRVPVELPQDDILRLPAADTWVLGPGEMPFPRLVDLDACDRDRVVAAVHDADSAEGGLVLVGADGVTAWLDSVSLGGLPLAVDTEPGTPVVWVATSDGYARFEMAL